MKSQVLSFEETQLTYTSDIGTNYVMMEYFLTPMPTQIILSLEK